MIVPTVGRVVWVVRPSRTKDIDQPEVGLITYVHNDHCINVAGFNATGSSFSLIKVPLVQGNEPTPDDGDYAYWMPYQKAQAAKSDTIIGVTAK